MIPPSFRSRRFCIRRVRVSAEADGFVLFRTHNANRIEAVSPQKSGPNNGTIDERALDGMRETIGQFTDFASGAMPDLAAWVGDYAAKVTHLTYHDVSSIDDRVGMAEQTARKFRD